MSAPLSSTEQQWHEIIERQRASGLTVSAFCRDNRVAPSSFFAWKRKLLGRDNGRPAAFVEAAVLGTSLAMPPAARASIKVRLRGGRRLWVSRRGFDAGLLAEVVATLEAMALQQAIDDEVAEYINAHRDQLDESGHRLVVRNGYKPARTILSGLGPIEIKPPRVDDRRVDENGVRFRFTSKILPPYLRKTQSIEDLVPWLYLKGISTGEMGDALVHLGFDGTGLSATSVTRMTEAWQGEYHDWSKRDLTGKHYVYLWADGIYFGCRLTDDRPCVLVLMGATADGTKELIAMVDGQRESETSWTALLLDAVARGLADPPKLATGDGSLGFWLALAKLFPSTKQQRCWVHKTANVLDKLPKGQQPAAKAMLHEIWMAAAREDATKAFDRFIATYGIKWPRATDCLEKDRAELLAFYDFPAEHWRHLRTSNPIESTFATVRLRTYRTKGPGSRRAGLAMAFKLVQKAQKGWQKLNGSEKLKDLIDGIAFVDGERKAA